MKIKITILFFTLFFAFCNKAEQKDKIEKVSKKTKITFNSSDLNVVCERNISLNETEICLPVIEGMKEVYMYSNVKPIIDDLLPKGSVALGFYVNSQTYENINKFDEIEYDDYLFVFSTELLVKENISRETYIDLSNFEEIFKFDWENQKNKIDKLLKTITVGKPAIFEKYNLNKNITTLITLNKYITDNSEVIKIIISNTFYLKNKMIITSYNYDYDGINSIHRAKEKNDYMAIRFLNENE